MSKRKLLALDVGEKRIGVAQADLALPIAVPYTTINVDGSEIRQILELIIEGEIDVLVIGYPRNQSGQPTAQTDFVEEFRAKLADAPCKIVYQDESLTSVLATKQLEARKKPYSKSDVDALAACLILEDYMERQL